MPIMHGSVLPSALSYELVRGMAAAVKLASPPTFIYGGGCRAAAEPAPGGRPPGSSFRGAGLRDLGLRRASLVGGVGGVGGGGADRSSRATLSTPEPRRRRLGAAAAARVGAIVGSDGAGQSGGSSGVRCSRGAALGEPVMPAAPLLFRRSSVLNEVSDTSLMSKRSTLRRSGIQILQ